jgi:type IV secretory pathway VirD2 relaxase
VSDDRNDERELWDLPRFNPRMGSRREAKRIPTLKVAVIRRFARMTNGWQPAVAGGRATSRRARHDIRPASASSRRCAVKARYVQMRAGGNGAALKHLAYIEREGVDRDGSKGRMFDGNGDVDRREFGAAIPAEQRQFRFIISPEDGNELDLREYTAALMSQVEKDLGRELRWAAVCHYDTDNPHVHVVVRGVDARGDDVRIDHDYISNGLRLRAQELATLELGPRTELHIERQMSREVGQERLTTLDRHLGRLASPGGVIEMSSLAHSSNIPRHHALARLETLESLDLVERPSPTSWRVVEGWQETLRQLGERGDIIKRMHHALDGRASSYRVFQPGSGVAVEGVIKQKGLHDELAGDPYVIVQTPRMEAVYVRLDPTTADTLKEGAAVRLKCEPQRWVKVTDPAIQREALANGGIYDPTAHLRKLGDMPVAVSGRWVEPKDVIAVNQRRPERLERYSLVTRLPDGRWHVPPDLVAQLEAREHSHPQHRLRVEPVSREAPTQVRGTAGDTADRAAVGARLAKELGLVYVESPERFRGRLFACPPSPSGREYVRVVDFATGRFTLAPKPPEATKLEGCVVSVAPDRQRGLSIEIDRGLSR